jgi:ferredoxin
MSMHQYLVAAAAILRAQVDPARCQGPARGAAIAPQAVRHRGARPAACGGDGTIPPASATGARLAQANCPESAIRLVTE